MLRSWMIGSAITAIVLVWGVREYARRTRWFDEPNDRSSHDESVPMGGGIGIVLPCGLYLLWALVTQPDVAPFGWNGLVALLLVSALGWIDDRSMLEPWVRLPLHVCAGLLIGLALLRLDLLGIDLPSVVLLLWWIFWTASMINVVNFLDGTDGLVGMQALIYALFCAVIFQSEPAALTFAYVLGAATIGFLLFNWPPASIFMGDVGSGALGVMFVLLGAWTMQARGWTVLHAFSPLAVLFVDEVITILVRVRRGDVVWRAHREHVYQLIVQSGRGHGDVAILYGLISVTGAMLSLFGPRGPLDFLALLGIYLAVVFMVLITLRT